MYFQYNWNKLTIPKHTHKNIVENNSMRKQRGTALVFVVLTLITIFSFAALAIDVGYLFVVRNQLQNAADAAALAGANYLYGDLYKTSSVSCVQSNVIFPNWSCAEANTTSAIQLNKATNTTLTDGQVASGYWNVTGNPTGLQSQSITPGTNNLPAVKVTIGKSNGQNGGGIATFFAGILGINTLNASATAVAVAASSPSCIGEGALLPVVMNKCAYDSYWNSSTNSPYLAPTYNNNGTIATNNTGYLLGYPYSKGKGNGNQITGPTETMGTPWVFWLTSSYQADHRPPNGTCEAGQWTSLSTESNSVNAVRDVIDNFGKANDNTLCTGTGIGHRVYIQPGAETTAYENRNQPSIQTCASKAAGTTGSCAYALIPVIDNDPIATGVWSDVKAFACVHVIKAVGGSDKYIELQMVGETDPNHKYCVAPNSGGGGPNYGVTQPPVLVNYSGNTY
jgi:Flp pilus assembly protein TadG